MLPFLIGTAAAGALQIEGIPAVFTVDGQIIEAGPEGLRSGPLSGGLHRLEARSMLGQSIAHLDVEVAEDALVVVQYHAEGFTVLRTAALPPALPRASASASVVGLDPGAFSVWIDGQEVPFVPASQAFIAADLLPGSHALEVRMGPASMLHHALVAVRDQHTACTALLGASFTLTCAASGSPLTAADLTAAPPPQPLQPEELLELLAALTAARRSSAQLALLAEATAHTTMTCAQLALLVEPIRLGEDRLAAFRLVMPALIDPQNGDILEGTLTFRADRRALRALLE